MLNKKCVQIAIDYMHKAVVEEETKSSRDCHKCLMKFLLDSFSDDVLNIGAGILVVVSTKLGRSRT